MVSVQNALCLGSDDPSNLIIICPNCHAITHALFGRWTAGGGIQRHNSQKRTLNRLAICLCLLISNEAALRLALVVSPGRLSNPSFRRKSRISRTTSFCLSTIGDSR